ncbi:MAG: hypothetical protein ACR2Q4_03860 [Geminicoccaceae bacterium]
MARLSHHQIAEDNRILAQRIQHFRVAADVLVDAWSPLATVLRIALIGSVAQPLRKEVPRFAPYRRAGIELWHECKDLDLVLWLSALDELPRLNRLRGQSLTKLCQTDGIGVAHHQVDVFVFEPGSDRYLGRLCTYGTCPKGKPECYVPTCGDHAFLQQIEGFVLQPDALGSDRCVVLFDRLGGIRSKANDLPTAGADEGTV